MSRLPSFSVIMPSYNQAGYLKEALDSILSQEYPQCEIIVMDGGSTDGSVELLRSYSNRIRWVSERDKGQSDALNKGFAKATGEIIGWLNSDDRFEPGALQAAGRFFAEHPETLWAFGHCKVMDEKGREIYRGISAFKGHKLRHYSYSAHLEGNFVSQMGVFFRRKVLDEIGGINENLYYAMDYDFWLRIGKRYPPGILAGTFGAFRVYQTSKSMSNFKQRFKEDFAIARKHAQGCPRAGWILFKHWMNNTLIAVMYTLLIGLSGKKNS